MHFLTLVLLGLRIIFASVCFHERDCQEFNIGKEIIEAEKAFVVNAHFSGVMKFNKKGLFTQFYTANNLISYKKCRGPPGPSFLLDFVLTNVL